MYISGIAGIIGIVAYNLYGFKNRKFKTSIYLIHTRVMAQGTFVACCMTGIIHELYKKITDPKPPRSKKLTKGEI